MIGNPDQDVCDRCGHRRYDHGQSGKCWSGSGRGNKCQCLGFTTDEDSEDDEDKYYVDLEILGGG